jgi:hypothetical protein
MDAPDQMQQAPPTAIGEQFLANGGGAPQPSSDANAPAPSAQPAPSPQGGPSAAAPTVDPATAKHNLIGKFFNNLTQSGSGSSASQMWRSIIGGALVGMGAAENAPVTRGPYGDIKSTSIGGAASRGFQAGSNMVQEQQDRQRKQAAQDAEEKRRNQESQIQLDDSVLRKASDARAQQESIRQSVEHEKRMSILDQSIQTGNWDQAQRTAKAAQDQVAMFNALQDVGAEPLADADGNTLQFSTHQEMEKAAHDNPKFFIGDFKTRPNYDPSTGKYSVFRVPNTDIKNVQLKDQQGNVHTIQRMSASEYLDFQARQQNITKGALGIEEAKVRLQQLREDRKSGSAYSEALAELDKVDGDADKLSPSSRTLLYTTASKNLGDAIRAKTSADKAEDAEAGAAASQAIQHYSGVLSQLHGNKPAVPAQVQQGVAANRASALFSKESNSASAFNIVESQVKAGTITKQEGQAIMGEYAKLSSAPNSGSAPSMRDNAAQDSEEPTSQPPL